MLPEPDGAPVTITEKVFVPVKDHPEVRPRLRRTRAFNLFISVTKRIIIIIVFRGEKETAADDMIHTRAHRQKGQTHGDVAKNRIKYCVAVAHAVSSRSLVGVLYTYLLF